MKKIYSRLVAFLFLALIVGFSSCSNEQDVVDENPEVKVVDGDDLIIIAKLGFDTSSVEDMGDYYLVEGDIMLQKKYLIEYLEQPIEDSKILKQGIINGSLVTLVNAKNITVRIDNSVPTSGKAAEWRIAVQEAILAWNNISGSCLHFTLTSAATADITIKYEYNSDGAYARALFPKNGKPGDLMIVNSYHDSYLYKTNTVIHEFGHTIGLLHSHEAPNPKDNEVVVPGTPEIDDLSIMSYARDRSLLPGFSYYDLVAICYLYPNNYSISANNTFACVNEDVIYTLSGNIPTDATINWQSTSTMTLISGQGTTTATYRASGRGYKKVDATITYNGINYLVESPQVWAGRPGLGGTQFISQVTAPLEEALTYRVPEEGATSYIWTCSGNSFNRSFTTNGSAINIRFHQVGIYTIICRAINVCGEFTTTYEVTVGGMTEPGGPEEIIL